jgi:hypothetical protein
LFDHGAVFSPRPRLVWSVARSRGQGWPSLRSSHGHIVARPRLDGGEHGARVVRSGRSGRATSGNMILDWAVNANAEITA